MHHLATVRERPSVFFVYDLLQTGVHALHRLETLHFECLCPVRTALSKGGRWNEATSGRMHTCTEL